MKITKRPKKNRIWLIVAACIVLTLAVGVTIAAYTSQGYQRGVVRNRDNEAVRFSSNYLQACSNGTTEDNYAVKSIVYSEESKKEEWLTIDIYIYNYAFGNAGLVNENEITYDMTITLSNATGTDAYEVKQADDGSLLSRIGTEHTYTKKGVTLAGNVADQDHYTIRIAGEDLNKIRITATAVPTNMAVTSNQFLAVILAPGTESIIQTFTCTGTFTDAAGGSDPEDYDAFNYEVSISGGRAAVTIDWNQDIVELDPFFLTKLSERGEDYDLEDGNAYALSSGTITFIMDQSDGTGTYLIPFYSRTDKTQIPDSWDAMTEVIKVHGESMDE